MSEALDGIDRLRSTSTKADALGAMWDLRDLAYDQPGAWQGFTAEMLFHALAEEVDGADADAVDWDRFTSLLGAALTAAVKWSSTHDS